MPLLLKEYTIQENIATKFFFVTIEIYQSIFQAFFPNSIVLHTRRYMYASRTYFYFFSVLKVGAALMGDTAEHSRFEPNI